MGVPGRVEAASLLLALDPPAWLLRHSAGVGEVAGYLASRIAARGERIDRALVEAAALLHDADKALPRGDPARGRPHAEGSATWLTARGHGELAGAVAGHPVTRLLDDAFDPAGIALEAAVVAYADKRVEQRLVPMAFRFAGWRRRYPGSWSSEQGRRALDRARRLEDRVCRAAKVRPEQVRRLRWVGAALAAARPSRTAVA
jgi:HD superfamily phosphodiesterase